MATRASDIARPFEATGTPDLNDLPVVASDIIYEGSAVGDNGSGLARPLVSADPFLGFAERQCDNSAGAASALRVRVRSRGFVSVAVVGAATAVDVGEPVYASDDDVFTLTASTHGTIGKVHRWVTGTTCIVYFEAVNVRSI